MTLKAVIATIVYYSAEGAIYFACAGRWNLPLAWLYFASNALVGLGLVGILAMKDPGLLKERMKPAPGDRDKLFMPVAGVCGVLQLVLAGMDAGRRHWPPVVSAPLQSVALLLTIAGLLFLSWALLCNSFFSSAVRLQPDRQQHVVTSGPYKYVRHPGYTGGILYFLPGGLALGSWWAGLAALPMVALTLRRTVLEDAMLHKGLPGYPEYAARVRFRLIPGIW